MPIIIGNWNEECSGTSTLTELCNEFELVSIFNRLNPNHKPFKTYCRGSSVLEFALAPPSIADRVTNFVYEPFLHLLKGDHCGFYFDIPEKVLFGEAKPSPFDSNSRGLFSKDIKNTKIHLEAVSEYLCEQNVYTCLHRLLNNEEPDHIEAERIDQTMTEACRLGEKNAKNVDTPTGVSNYTK